MVDSTDCLMDHLVSGGSQASLRIVSTNSGPIYFRGNVLDPHLYEVIAKIVDLNCSAFKKPHDSNTKEPRLCNIS